MVGSLPAGETSALVLADDELRTAGEHAEGLLATSARAVMPGGAIFVSALGAIANDGLDMKPRTHVPSLPRRAAPTPGNLAVLLGAI